MNSHLNQNEITDAVLGMSEPEAEQHLDECRACHGQSQIARELLAGFASEARHEAERSEAFWSRQRLVIWSRIDQMARRRALRLAWSAAAAAAATVVLWMTLAQVPDQHPVTPPPPPVAERVSDEVLLLRVEAVLEHPMPQALAPAEIITRELTRSATAAKKRPAVGNKFQPEATR